MDSSGKSKSNRSQRRRARSAAAKVEPADGREATEDRTTPASTSLGSEPPGGIVEANATLLVPQRGSDNGDSGRKYHSTVADSDSSSGYDEDYQKYMGD